MKWWKLALAVTVMGAVAFAVTSRTGKTRSRKGRQHKQ
jgi:hypothetical protein